MSKRTRLVLAGVLVVALGAGVAVAPLLTWPCPMLSPTLTLCVARVAVSLGLITGKSATLVSEAAKLRFGRPSTLARSAIDSGDSRLVGVAGFGLGFPGAAVSEADQLQATLGVREILGQGDQLDSIYELLYQYASYEFALHYNRTILQHVKGRAG